MNTASPRPPLLEMRGIRKRFPGLTALDDVDFTVEGGEIHALIGQNGAGKSTLMKILAGSYHADDGSIIVNGRPSTFQHPTDALREGIGVVYQELSLVPKLSVAENIFLGREPGGLRIDDAAMVEQSTRLLSRLGVDNIDVEARVDALPIAQQQLVAIVKVLAYEPRILVLDEPTAALARDEIELLFAILRNLRSQGIGLVYISHRFKEILQLCDRVTVLRDGKVVAVTSAKDISEDRLVELTIGAKAKSFFRSGARQVASESNEVVLTARNISVRSVVDDVSFELHRGEIVGITGLLGAGQNQLARALFGLAREITGTLTFHGRSGVPRSPRAAIASGIGLITDQRKTEGIVEEASVLENVSLASLKRHSRLGGFLRRGPEMELARRFIAQLNVRTPSPWTKVKALSGGNQQKVVLAKWLERDQGLLICISPTQGVDVGAKAEIYSQLAAMASEGKTIVIVSEDHLEVLNVCDRILVMHEGRLIREFDRLSEELDEERLLSAIQGNPA